jgi:hypothetical protein
MLTAYMHSSFDPIERSLITLITSDSLHRNLEKRNTQKIIGLSVLVYKRFMISHGMEVAVSMDWFARG